jgi:hypothetical protein
LKVKNRKTSTILFFASLITAVDETTVGDALIQSQKDVEIDCELIMACFNDAQYVIVSKAEAVAADMDYL